MSHWLAVAMPALSVACSLLALWCATDALATSGETLRQVQRWSELITEQKKLNDALAVALDRVEQKIRDRGPRA